MTKKTSEKIYIHTINIELLKKQCLDLHESIKVLYQTLNRVEVDRSIIYVKKNNKISTINNVLIKDVSIFDELQLFITNKYNQNAPILKISGIYSLFAAFMLEKHKIDIPQYITPQKIGVFIKNIDTSCLPYKITRHRSADGIYYLIKSKTQPQ